MNGYMTVQDAAEKWGITPRQVQVLCKENRIKGATRLSRIWIIPEKAEKPTGNRKKYEPHMTLRTSMADSKNEDR